LRADDCAAAYRADNFPGMKTSTWRAATVSLWVTSHRLRAGAPGVNNPGTPWPAMDGLAACSLPRRAKVGIRSNRCVGIFYFLWHDAFTGEAPNDLAKILPQDRIF